MIANFPTFVTDPQDAKILDLGSGNELSPKLASWAPIGAAIGFVLWALATPTAAPFHSFLHERGPTQVLCLIAGGMVVVFLVHYLLLMRLPSLNTLIQFGLLFIPLFLLEVVLSSCLLLMVLVTGITTLGHALSRALMHLTQFR